MSTELYIRYAESLLAVTGTGMLLDPLHGQVTKAFAPVGYPSLFPVATGAWKLAIVALNFVEDGKYSQYGQWMLATLMGGAIWHHAIGEGHPAASVAPLVFLGLSAAVPYLQNKAPLPMAIAAALACAAGGFAIGHLLPKSKKSAAKKEKK